ncbi:MAG TPA: hypothetical protein VIH90_01205, partial [Candidatus Saccharimonadales bacterium]
MNLTDSSLDGGYEASDYNSSLESSSSQVSSPVQSQIPTQYKKSLFQYDKHALIVTFIALASIVLIGLAVFLFSLFNSAKTNNSLNSPNSSGGYSIGSSLSLKQASGNYQIQLGQANKLTVNGNLSVSKTLILSPTAAPTAPVDGQIYYNQANHAPYYFNGTQFVSLDPVSIPEYVTSLGGSAGVIGLGNGLTVSGGSLSVSSSLLQSVANAANTPKVTSLQGLTGSVSLTAGNGIAISGTSITNTGVVNLTSSDSSVSISSDGNGGFDLSVVKGGAGQTSVLLAQAAAQVDSSTFPSININKTGSGSLLNLESNGTSVFQVDQSGRITVGTIDYSQVQGTPPTPVTQLGGVTGAISLGTGLTISGNVLSTTSGGVVDIVGNNANQILVANNSGTFTLSTPQDIGTSSNVTFGSLSLSGALTLPSSGNTINGNITQSGAGSLTTGTGAVSLQGATTASAGLTVTNSGNVAFQKATDNSTTGNINNLSINGALVRFTGASAQTLTGIAGGTDGRILTIVNAAATALKIHNNDTVNSAASSVIITGTGGDINIASGASISLVYDAGANVWRVEGSASTVGGPGANTALSNLVVTSINQALIANANNSLDLGSSGTAWRSLYAGTSVLTPGVDTISAGTLSLGTSTATAISLGKTGVTTTNNGSLTVSQLLTASNGLTVTTGAVNLTGTSGALALSGLGASSISTGANALTVTSSN